MRILGIDPGFGRVGWGIVEGQGNNWTHIVHGCIETNAKQPFVARLEDIFTQLTTIIKTHTPDHAAVEELFFAKNVTTGINVSQARGVILLCLTQAKLPIEEYKPSTIKQSLTGYGNADKRQMQKMIKLQLNLKQIPTPDDVADALAVALTCGLHLR